jgi:hypothetical protein
MASTVNWCEDNGVAIAGGAGSNRGTTRTTGVSNVNWKSIADATSNYGDYPITAGQNSYEKFQSLLWTGSFNMITGVTFQHVSGVFANGVTLKGYVTGSGFYTAPSQTSNALLTYDMTLTGSISTGYSVRVGGGLGPEHSGKNLGTIANPAWSEYITTQLQTNVSASAGDTSGIFQISWTEN